MNKKNYSFTSAIAGILLVSGLSVGMQSCGNSDNPILVVEDPNANSVTITNDGATVTVTVPSEITEALSSLKSDITNKGTTEEYVVDINGTGLSASGSDNTITVPSIDDADINLNFKSAITTNAPLEVKSESAATESSPSKNKLTITMPDVAEAAAIDLNITMPETTVTLASSGTETVYDEVTALTANNTLIIGKGVKVKNLKVKGGNVVVDEGIVESIVIATDITASITLDGSKIDKLYISDGAAVNIINDIIGKSPNIRIIDGDGTGTFNVPLTHLRNPQWDDVTNDWEKDEEGNQILYDVYSHYINQTERISNVKISHQSNNNTLQVGTAELENCSIDFDGFYFGLWDLNDYSPSKTSYTIKNCKFTSTNSGNTMFSLQSPFLSNGLTSFNTILEDCEFSSAFSKLTIAAISDTDTGNLTFTFNNCTIGGNPLNSGQIKDGTSSTETLTVKYIIDGTEYVGTGNPWTLTQTN